MKDRTTTATTANRIVGEVPRTSDIYTEAPFSPKFAVIEKNIPIPKRRRCANHNKFLYDFVDHAEVGDSIALNCRKQCNVLRNVISSRKKKSAETVEWHKKFTERKMFYKRPAEHGMDMITVKYWRYWRVE